MVPASSPPRSSLVTPTPIAATIASVARAPAGASSERARIEPSQAPSSPNGEDPPSAKPAAARRSSSSVHSSSGLGRSARISCDELGDRRHLVVDLAAGQGPLDCFELALDRGVQGGRCRQTASSQALLSFSIVRWSRGAGVGRADPDHVGDLGVAEAGEELERDQLALAGVERGHRLRAAPSGAEPCRPRRRAASRRRPRGRRRARRCACGAAARRARRCGRSRTARRAACPSRGSKRPRLR